VFLVFLLNGPVTHQNGHTLVWAVWIAEMVMPGTFGQTTWITSS